MKFRISLLLIIIPVFFTACADRHADHPGTFEYPVTNKLDITDDYHGIIVADPYR